MNQSNFYSTNIPVEAALSDTKKSSLIVHSHNFYPPQKLLLSNCNLGRRSMNEYMMMWWPSSIAQYAMEPNFLWVYCYGT